MKKLLISLLSLSIACGSVTDDDPNQKLVLDSEFHSLDGSCKEVQEVFLPAGYHATAKIFDCNDKTCVKITLQYEETSIQCVR